MKTMTMKAILLAVLLGSVSAMAGDFKVGVVDTERILHESAPAMKAAQKIEKDFSSRDLEIKKMMKLAKELQDSLEKNPAAISEVERRNKERELNALNVNLQ
ncbi:MAG: hypothetical protein COS43_02210, partial [Gallionellales bacterium CG03_land_8_20_14_0_80_55_15]